MKHALLVLPLLMGVGDTLVVPGTVVHLSKSSSGANGRASARYRGQIVNHQRKSRRRGREGGERRCGGGGGVSMNASEGRGESAGQEAIYRVVFMRHGQSEWNRVGRFIGWYDSELTDLGMQEAQDAGKTLKEFGMDIDEIFCSYLKRSIKTGWLVAESMDKAYIPVHTDWRLNEQMYGALQGRFKKQVVSEFGVDLVQKWRRSYDVAPPAVEGGVGYFPPNDPKYAKMTDMDIPFSWCGSPQTESLKDCQARAMELWTEEMIPRIRANKTLLIVGHGNVIRAMIKRMDRIPNPLLKQVNIPRATALVYDLDKDLRPIASASSIGIISGRFLGNPIAIAKALQAEGAGAQLGIQQPSQQPPEDPAVEPTAVAADAPATAAAAPAAASPSPAEAGAIADSATGLQIG